MKKVFVSFVLTFAGTVSAFSQYSPSCGVRVNVDSNGTPNGTYTVNCCKSGPADGNAIHFDVYLSYKGKRVSDYYSFGAPPGCNYGSASRTVTVWPDEVPEGHEKYVTVQTGREPAKRDRRDDD